MKTNVLHEALLKIGLQDFEADLYLVIMNSLNPSITELAKKMSVQRLKIYQSLKVLEEYHLIKLYEKNKKLVYELESPSKVLTALQQKESELNSLHDKLSKNLPSYLTKFYNQPRQTGVKIYEGRNQFRVFFESILVEEHEQIYHFGSNEAIVELLGWEEANEWVRKRVEKGIRTTEIIFPSFFIKKRSHLDTEELRNIKVLPGEFENSASYLLFANKVALWNAFLPKIVVIEDNMIYELMSTNFKILWDSIK
jgi:sugar-specific transcriptional regulator TrmB